MPHLIWAFPLACAASALFHLLVVVPRLPPLAPDGDEAPPDLATLATPRDAVGCAVLAGAAGLLVAPNVPALQLPMWFGLAGAGAVLAWVDLRTTWLPRRLNLWCLAQVAAGAGVLAAALPLAALGALVGGAAAFGLFHLVWALTSGLGYGDVRLAGVVGAVAGASGAGAWFAALLAATVIGALWGIGHALTTRGAPVPFAYGPALWVGPIVAAAMA